MKKILLLATVVLTSTALQAAPDKKKKKEAEKKVETVQLLSASDTLSYAAGKSLTRGLMNFLQKEYQLDTAYIADFIDGYREAMTKQGDAKYNARNAGIQIAKMVEDRMLPGMIKQFEGTEHTIDRLKVNEGFIAEIAGDTTIMTLEQAVDKFDTMRKTDQERKDAAWRTSNEQWLKDNAAKEGVKTTASGLQYKVITEGTGETPDATSTVTVKYEGKMIDGTVFDSSYKRNPQTTSFPVNQVIKGWTEALCMMPVGSKWELYIPQELGYGARTAGSIKPYSTLIFTVEVVKTEKKEEASKKADEAVSKTSDTNKSTKKVTPAKKLTPAKKTVKK